VELSYERVLGPHLESREKRERKAGRRRTNGREPPEHNGSGIYSGSWETDIALRKFARKKRLEGEKKNAGTLFKVDECYPGQLSEDKDRKGRVRKRG